MNNVYDHFRIYVSDPESLQSLVERLFDFKQWEPEQDVFDLGTYLQNNTRTHIYGSRELSDDPYLPVVVLQITPQNGRIGEYDLMVLKAGRSLEKNDWYLSPTPAGFEDLIAGTKRYQEDWARNNDKRAQFPPIDSLPGIRLIKTYDQHEPLYLR